MKDREIRVTQWDDGWSWTVFDADPDFQSSQVDGVLVPYALAEHREPSALKALRAALVQATPAGCGDMRIVVPAAVATAWAVICTHDHITDPRFEVEP